MVLVLVNLKKLIPLEKFNLVTDRQISTTSETIHIRQRPSGVRWLDTALDTIRTPEDHIKLQIASPHPTGSLGWTAKIR